MGFSFGMIGEERFSYWESQLRNVHSYEIDVFGTSTRWQTYSTTSYRFKASILYLLLSCAFFAHHLSSMIVVRRRRRAVPLVLD